MRGKLTQWLWEDFLGPRHKRRFWLRIWLRVRWLFFKRWWREEFRFWGMIGALQRPTLLFVIGLAIPMLLLWSLRDQPWIRIDKGISLTDTLTWKDAIQPLLLFIGLPSAFILWAFRDHNAAMTLTNQRKDINLKEFQEIQLRAAGALDEKLPEEARQTLQVAAIHQLRPFLRGEYGTSFRRPAWELLRALLTTSAEKLGYKAITDWVDNARSSENVLSDCRKSRGEEIRSALGKITPSPLSKALLSVVNEDAFKILKDGMPLVGSRFDGADLVFSILAGLNLRHCSFAGASLSGVHIEDSWLEWAHFEGATMSFARLERARLFRANFQSTFISHARFDGAYLEQARLDSATLSHCHFEGANLVDAIFDDYTNLHGATYDDATQFFSRWSTLLEDEREMRRRPWRERGMIHIDEARAKGLSD